eukprot:1172049-Prymnesium_polylepis.1
MAWTRREFSSEYGTLCSQMSEWSDLVSKLRSVGGSLSPLVISPTFAGVQQKGGRVDVRRKPSFCVAVGVNTHE